ncbi:ester cyclase [Saccharothrix sp. NRRL B-16314]|uniref:ester cyclase n=1 Tax=Saccharothrix sp. NRRL B-16314 TaxID=1463825 RepID=UPI0018CC056E|nr:ester cyclase [Saccharothrix sp. NRRL B-16314]
MSSGQGTGHIRQDDRRRIADDDGAGAADPTCADVKSIAADMFGALWDERRFDVLDRHVDRNAVSQLAVPARSAVTGSAGFKAFAEGMFTALPDLRRVTHQVFGCGDRALVRSELTGTHRGPFLGIPPTGTTVVLSEMVYLRFERDAVVELVQQADLLGVMGQLGLTPPDGVGPLGSVLHTVRTVGRFGRLAVRAQLDRRKVATS